MVCVRVRDNTITLRKQIQENKTYSSMPQNWLVLFHSTAQYLDMLESMTAESRHCNQVMLQEQQFLEARPSKLPPTGEPELRKSRGKASLFLALKSEQSRERCAEQ